MNKKALIFISAGLLCVMAALALYIYNTVQSGNAAEASAEIVSALSEQIDAEGESAASFPADNPDREMPSPEYEGNGYVGILSLPSLGLELPVGDALSYEALQSTPCLYSGSIYSRDMVIGAHNYDSHFGGINSLGIGDRVIFTDVENHVFICEVVDIETLRPEQNDVLTEKQNGSIWDLTLFTCNYSGSERVTVRCGIVK